MRYYIPVLDWRRAWCWITGGHDWDEPWGNGVHRWCRKCWHMQPGVFAQWRCR